MKTKINTKVIALSGILTALALVLGYVEHLLPLPVGVYGMKLGLSNLVTVTALYLLGAPAAIVINVTRILLSALLFGNTVSLAYSLAGGVVATVMMILAKRWKRLGISGVSVCGGVAHNIAQLIVAAVIVDNLKIAFYLPVLLAAGAITGFAIGACALPITKTSYLKKISKTDKN